MEEHGIIRRIDRSFPDELKPVLRIAKDNGWWIYQKSTKRWMTPDEFHKEGRGLLMKDPDGRLNVGDFFADNPWNGLRVRVDHLQKVAAEISAFVERVEMYYKKNGYFR